ncbi:MAG TPA: glycosyltransferase family 2 protein [Candidatus Omnitrophota bacterium]|nr:glycosyltransferase family 2 protein [Candidatus Omnitrophota bacterium]
MKLSILIPCYNEARTLPELIDRVKAVDLDPVQKEIIVVDDGSSDETPKLLKEIEPGGVKVYRHERNRGKGAAVRTALSHATGDLVIVQDADLEYDPRDYLKLLEVMKDDSVQTVYGSRAHHNKWSHISFGLGGRFVSLLTNLLYGSRLTDEPTCYKMFRTGTIRQIELKADGFDFCPEITAKILKKGIKIVEVPISYDPRHLNEGKKISWKDGLIAIWTLIKLRFTD